MQMFYIDIGSSASEALVYMLGKSDIGFSDLISRFRAATEVPWVPIAPAASGACVQRIEKTEI
eukprot:2878215-Pyramimonas_sp.AAC.1